MVWCIVDRRKCLCIDGEVSQMARPLSSREILLAELRDCPEPLVDEVVDFVRFLKSKKGQDLEPALLSESALEKDWLRPEEDRAWQGL